MGEILYRDEDAPGDTQAEAGNGQTAASMQVEQPLMLYAAVESAGYTLHDHNLRDQRNGNGITWYNHGDTWKGSGLTVVETSAERMPEPEHADKDVERFLEKYATTATASRIMRIQKMLSTGLNLPIDYEPTTAGYYELIAKWEAYYGGCIALPMMARALGFSSIEELLFKEDGTPRRILSIGFGYGDDLRMVDAARRKLRPLKLLEKRIHADPSSQEEIAREFIRDMKQKVGVALRTPDPHLLGIDLTRTFPELLRAEGIPAVQHDICADDLFAHPLIHEGEWDVVIFVLGFDRVHDFAKACQNIRGLLRKGQNPKENGRFLFALPNEITNVGSVGNIVFWDKATDPRGAWVSSDTNEVRLQASKAFAAEGLETLWQEGQPYVCLSPHATVGMARDLLLRQDQLLAEAGQDRFKLQVLADLTGRDFPQAEGFITPKRQYRPEDAVIIPEVFDLTLYGGR